MTATGPRAALASRYLRLVASAAAATCAAGVLGYLPTRRMAGAGALAGMVGGCAIGMVAGALGAVPIALAGAGSAAARLQAALLSMGLRFGIVVLLGLAAVWSGWFARGPLLAWMAISYTVQLVAETRFAVQDAGGR